MTVTLIGLFLLLAGFVIGLGAVTVIDVHGLLSRRSPYWTETTIRVHKVTKPLIWLGIGLAVIGGTLFYSIKPLTWVPLAHATAVLVLVANGSFLSFYISPLLLARERAGRERELLSQKLQLSIIASFIVSFIGWWGSLALLAWYLVSTAH
jgi:hypothetical protein